MSNYEGPQAMEMTKVITRGAFAGLLEIPQAGRWKPGSNGISILPSGAPLFALQRPSEQ